MFPEPTELLLIGYLVESIWTPRSKSNTLTPKSNSQTCWLREISHVMNGIIFNVCLTIAISVLQSVLKWCRKEHKKIQVKKESQQNRNQWWNWSRDAAKGLHQLYLLLHQKAQWKPNTKVKLLWVRKLRSTIERWDPLYTHTHQASQNGNIDKSWSSQEWKSDDLMDDRTVRPVVNAQHTDRFIIENDETNSYAEAESELSLGSRLFLHRVNDQVRKRQKQSSKDATKDCDKHSVIWECLCLQHCRHLYSWWRVTQTIGIPSKIQKISQWNRFSTYLRNWKPNNQMRSMEWKQLTGKTLHGSICLWLVMNKSSVSSAQESAYSQILYCVLERWTRTLNQIWHGKTDWRGSKVHNNTELWTELMVCQWNSSGTSSQDSPHCNLPQSPSQDWA